jgi:hypothetical protein
MDKLTEALTNEIGPPRVKNDLPTSTERYHVTTYIWATWNDMLDQIKNIPWWKIHTRRQARKKINKFQNALHVLHHYVPVKDD